MDQKIEGKALIIQPATTLDVSPGAQKYSAAFSGLLARFADGDFGGIDRGHNLHAFAYCHTGNQVIMGSYPVDGTTTILIAAEIRKAFKVSTPLIVGDIGISTTREIMETQRNFATGTMVAA